MPNIGRSSVPIRSSVVGPMVEESICELCSTVVAETIRVTYTRSVHITVESVIFLSYLAIHLSRT
jgi:hypothetical protein